MTIAIDRVQLQVIYTHAAAVYPEECCGILLGKQIDNDKIVTEAIATINAWDEAIFSDDFKTSDDLDRTKHSRYIIPPQAIFQAQKRARELQLEIVGFFHSHPDTQAIPSNCDRDRAWEVYSYPIVSVIRGKVTEIKSWVLDRNGIFQPEEIELVDTLVN
jgi:proteasome lid subunit RPN8/RPN11